MQKTRGYLQKRKSRLHKPGLAAEDPLSLAAPCVCLSTSSMLAYMGTFGRGGLTGGPLFSVVAAGG